MWICFNDAFVSVVKDNERPGNMLVRARAKAHLSKLFPRMKIKKSPNADYRWRVSVPAAQIAKLVAKRVTDIDYDNFKDSVREDKLHNMYALWWSDHRKFQDEREW